MNDQKTPHLALPMPHPYNDLEVDILRLRAALTILDTHLAGVDGLLAVDDEDMDTIHEIVEALKLAREDVESLKALVDTEIGSALTGLENEMKSMRALIYAGL